MRRRIFNSIAVILVLLITFLTSYAEDKYWIGTSGSWGDPANWNPFGVPLYPDYVYLTQSDAINRTVYVGSEAGRGVVNPLRIDATGTGSITLDVSGTTSHLWAYDIYVGYDGTGKINHSDGSIGFFGDLSIGKNSGSTGIYNLSGRGELFAEVGWLTLGWKGIGIFNQTGGSLYVEALQVHKGGTYNLSGGIASIDPMYYLTIGGTFNQTEGSLATGVFISDNGTYNLSGGTMYCFPGGGMEGLSFYNGGTFNYSGGKYISAHSDYPSKFLNNGTTNLSGSGTRTIEGDIINNGTFKTTNTTAKYIGTFTNNGAYISDPAAQYFNDLIIGQKGYIKGGLLDFFYIGGDFKNQSTMSTAWNTSLAYLGFVDGADSLHDFYLAWG